MNNRNSLSFILFYLFKRAATSIQRFYRFYKGITKSRGDVLPPPTSPFNPPAYDAHLESYNSHTNNESDISGGSEKHDGNSSRKVTENSVYVPVMNYISVGDESLRNAGSSSFLARSKTSTDKSKTSSDTIKRGLTSLDRVMESKASLDSRDVSHTSVNISPGDHSSRSFGKTSHSNEGKKKVTRRMTIDLVKLESSTIGTIESATGDVTMNSGLGLGR